MNRRIGWSHKICNGRGLEVNREADLIKLEVGSHLSQLECLDASDPHKRALERTKLHFLYLRDRMHRDTNEQ